MRYKTISKRLQPRARLFSTVNLAWQRYPRPLAALALTIWLVLPSSTFEARAHEQQPAGGDASAPRVLPQAVRPDVHITQVKALPALNDTATTDVEIRWTVLVPRMTRIHGFDVVIEVRYTDGSRSAARSQPLKPSARAAILQLATHPRQNSRAIVKDFKAAVKLRFRIASSFAVVQQVAGPNDGVRPSPDSPAGPEVVITAARLVTQGCLTGQQCVDVRWTAAVPRNITISEFTASVEALRKDGTQTTDSKTVSGQDRQARLQAGPADFEVDSMKVSVLTSFWLLDSKTAVKEGTF